MIVVMSVLTRTGTSSQFTSPSPSHVFLRISMTLSRIFAFHSLWLVALNRVSSIV